MQALPSKSSSRYHSLDIWRGIACLSVIVYHTVGLDGSPGQSAILTALGSLAMRGWIGVPLFFVISGYCIAASASRPQAFTDYFLRRLRRIFPPLWIFLGLTGVVVLATGATGLGVPIFEHSHGGFSTIASPTQLSIWQYVSNFTLTAGWLPYLGGPFWRFGTWWLGHLWTLGYEEQFYVVVGVLLMTLGSRWWRGVELLTFAVVILWRTGAVMNGFFFDGSWLLFALGLFLFHHINVAKGRRRRVLPMFLGIAALWVATRLILSGPTVLTSLTVATFFTVVLLVLHRWDLALAGLSIAQPLAWCGRRCYSVYLLHYPLTKAITGLWLMMGLTGPRPMWLLVVPTTVASCLLLAHPFHQYVERPFMAAARKAGTRAGEAEAV